MRESQKKKTGIVLIVAALILAAYLCKIFGSRLSFRIGLVRSAIHVGLLLAWGVSVHRRVIQPQLNRLMRGIVGFMIFWLLIKTIRYEFGGAMPIFVARYLWYLYYPSMLFIPPLTLYAAHFLGRPEHYKPAKSVYLPFLVSGILLALLLTNDMHRLVFSFPKGPDFFENGEYTHEAGFYLIVAWIVMCCGGVLFLLFAKARLPGVRRRIVFPMIPFLAVVLYIPLYLAGGRMFFLYAGDLTVVFCLLTISILESCFQCRLLPTNVGYDRLFHASSIRAVITDQNYEELIRAGDYVGIEKSVMRQAEDEPVILSSELRLHSAPVGDGHILWQEDISALTETLAELEDLNQYLQGQTETIRKDYSMAQQERRLSEKNRLYHRILARTKSEIEYYLALTQELERETDPDRVTALVRRIAFVSSYIKRQNNLIFLDEENGQISVQELAYCIRESLQNLRLWGIPCSMGLEGTFSMPFLEIAWLYETFYHLVKALSDGLRSVSVSLFTAEEKPTLRMILESDVPLPEAYRKNVAVTEREGRYHILFSYSEGGASL